MRALEALAETSLRSGELGEALTAARAAVTAAPFRESAHRLLMEAHEAAGNPAEALRAFDDLRRLLRDELGTSPGPDALAVHARLLHGGAPAHGTPEPVTRRWPAPLDAARSRHAFVGRAAEAAVLQRAWGEAAAGGRGFVVLAGEAGIGKTRLSAELGGHAHAGGALVLYGRLDEEAPAPYQPFVQMLRGWAGGASLAPLAGRLGPRAAELGALLPEFGAPVAGEDGTLRGNGVRRPAAAPVRRDRRAAGRDRGRRAAPRRARRPALGRPPDPPAARAPRARARRPSACCSSPRRARTRGTRRSPRCSPACAATACSSAWS